MEKIAELLLSLQTDFDIPQERIDEVTAAIDAAATGEEPAGVAEEQPQG